MAITQADATKSTSLRMLLVFELNDAYRRNKPGFHYLLVQCPYWLHIQPHKRQEHDPLVHYRGPCSNLITQATGDSPRADPYESPRNIRARAAKYSGFTGTPYCSRKPRAIELQMCCGECLFYLAVGALELQRQRHFPWQPLPL